MARTAVPGRLMKRTGWWVARVVDRRTETATAGTLVLEVPDWPGHLPGQHVDLRLTAEDGYQAARSYSISAPADGDRIEVTVQRVPEGEVSPYLLDGLSVGDQIEVRGPVGGYFVWRMTDPSPVLLVGGGSGIAPLMAMIRARREANSRVPFRLIYSVRSEQDVYFADELRRRARDDRGLDVAYVYTREVPEGLSAEAHRIAVADVNTHGWPAQLEPVNFVCGPTGFVEAVSDILVALGHEPRRIKTERFGPTG
ncbi:oxidoreductase [Plantactinospora sp. BB1]|nr:oxidoreductase [Plantactinospora sp. BB1]